MKAVTMFIVLACAAAVCITAPASARTHSCRVSDDGDLFRGEDVDIEINEGSIVFTHEDDDETVEITEDGELSINGRTVRLDRDQRKLVEAYYDTFDGIFEAAKQIAIDGAKIGVKSVDIGLSAVLGTLFLLAEDWDTEDLEDELERKGEKIERLAERLEKRAKKLEARAERLEDLHEELRNEIDGLDDLGWF